MAITVCSLFLAPKKTGALLAGPLTFRGPAPMSSAVNGPWVVPKATKVTYLTDVEGQPGHRDAYGGTT